MFCFSCNIWGSNGLISLSCLIVTSLFFFSVSYTVNFIVEPGSSVTGTIDAKFDNGYLITVNLGSEKLKGVLYHTPLPPHVSQNSNASAEPPHQNPKSYQLTFKDPSRPKSNRSGYNFFFAENYNRLKPLYHGQEKEITKKIGDLWNRLTDSEKQVPYTHFIITFYSPNFVSEIFWCHWPTESRKICSRREIGKSAVFIVAFTALPHKVGHVLRERVV